MDNELLFYNRELSCLVAFELKLGEFKAEYLGKMNLYLEALDRNVKKDYENPSVGIILCSSKDKEVVENKLDKDNKDVEKIRDDADAQEDDVKEKDKKEVKNSDTCDDIGFAKEEKANKIEKDDEGDDEGRATRQRAKGHSTCTIWVMEKRTQWQQ